MDLRTRAHALTEGFLALDDVVIPDERIVTVDGMLTLVLREVRKEALDEAAAALEARLLEHRAIKGIDCESRGFCESLGCFELKKLADKIRGTA